MLGGDDHVPAVADLVDFYETRAIGRDSVESGERFCLKLQLDSGAARYAMLRSSSVLGFG
jgi:hypothetical protein